MLQSLQVLLAGVALAVFIIAARRKCQLPPGPAGYPIVGNLFQFPKHNAWETFAKWSKEYGEIIHLSILGRSIILLSSQEVITDLLDKRGAVYSDRPITPFAELVGHRKGAVAGPYDNRHRVLRKLITSGVRKSSMTRIQELQDHCTLEFLSELNSSPQNYSEHISRCVANIVLRLSHGYSVTPVLKEDPLVSLLETSMQNFTEVSTPGRWWVDVIPALNFVPEWFPGTAWKQKAKYYKGHLQKTYSVPFEMVKGELEKGTAVPSFTSELLLKEPNPTAEEEDLYRWASGAFYAAGSHTTLTTLRSFFLSMVLFPEVQKKAQEELDRVVGPNRLPGFEDREKLPYIEGILKEVYRSHPVAPLAIPHRLTRDDTYKDYFIPAGSIIYANSWAIMHNENLYPSPKEFKPERYIGSTNSDLNPDPRTFAFGYGRRVCPGLPLADTTFFLAVARTLAVFSIGPPMDPSGKQIEIEARYTTGIISMPEPFQCTIVPRSKQTTSLLSRA